MITSSMRYFWLRLAEIRIVFGKTRSTFGIIMAVIKKTYNTIIIIVRKWEHLEIRLVKFGYKP